ncbi:MAG: hypothetical protein II800_04960, partial [Lachnospiraceae bacterium]|nr:hypothetical protein [Lachnospiraceae bacterium]
MSDQISVKDRGVFLEGRPGSGTRESGNDRRIPVREFLFFLYFGLMLWIKGVGMTGGTFYNAVLLFTTLFVIIGMLFFWRATPEEYLVDAALLILCGILPWRIAGNQGPLWCILLVIAMRCGI